MTTPFRCTICRRCHGLADDMGMRIGVDVCEVHGNSLMRPGECPDWTPVITPDACRAILTLTSRMDRDGRV